jgi:hypothetical protein
MEEKRKIARKRTLHRGRAICGDESAVFDCTIRNVSAFGARIDSAAFLPLPQRFRLDNTSSGQTFDVRIVWKNDNSAGVEFVFGDTPARILDEATLGALNGATTENRALRAQVRRLESGARDSFD